jgi:hypothetical protein
MAFNSAAGAACSATGGLFAALRCFIELVSDPSPLFDLEDLVVRGLEFSADAVLSGATAVSSPALLVFFEVLLNCMQAIRPQGNIFCSICFALEAGHFLLKFSLLKPAGYNSVKCQFRAVHIRF